jgi:predicted TIM-barrel enzyme
MPETRSQILARFRQKITEGRPIIGGGAGTGISAKFEEAGGIDLIVIYNSGRFRMAGHGSLAGLLPYGDANAIVMEMAQEVLPVVRKTPVLAGVCGTDPMRLMDRFLKQVKDAGFAGVQNFPTVCLFDGTLRVNMEETGFGYQKEVEMIGMAHDLDLLTTPYATNPDEAARMTKAGCDILVAHMGLTTTGSIGAKTAKTLDQSVRLIDEMADAAKSVRSDVIVICHGGPIAEPHDAEYIIKHCRAVDGFYGASSMERLPTERAIRQQTEEFTRIRTEKRGRES